MALTGAISNITPYFFRPRKISGGRGIKMVEGTMTLGAESGFVTSGIEKYFRKCLDIQAYTTSGVPTSYIKSATHKLGRLYICGSTNNIPDVNPSTATGAWHFVAFGI